jgi:hypothetical protein
VSEERELCEHHGHYRGEGHAPPAGSYKHHSHNGPRHQLTKHGQNSGVVAALAGEKRESPLSRQTQAGDSAVDSNHRPRSGA